MCSLKYTFRKHYHLANHTESCLKAFSTGYWEDNMDQNYVCTVVSVPMPVQTKFQVHLAHHCDTLRTTLCVVRYESFRIGVRSCYLLRSNVLSLYYTWQKLCLNQFHHFLKEVNVHNFINDFGGRNYFLIKNSHVIRTGPLLITEMSVKNDVIHRS